MTISKNVFFDKLDDIVTKCNNTYHRTTKMKHVDVNTYIDSSKQINDKDHKFKNFDISRISKYKSIFTKAMFRRSFCNLKVKNTVPWTNLISDLNRGKIVGTFSKKEFKKTNQKEFRVEKRIKRKAINYILNGKAMIILLIVELIKKT